MRCTYIMYIRSVSMIIIEIRKYDHADGQARLACDKQIWIIIDFGIPMISHNIRTFCRYTLFDPEQINKWLVYIGKAAKNKISLFCEESGLDVGCKSAIQVMRKKFNAKCTINNISKHLHDIIGCYVVQSFRSPGMRYEVLFNHLIFSLSGHVYLINEHY